MKSPEQLEMFSINQDVATPFDEVLAELDRATHLYGPFVNAHHGYAVILEELEEAWDEIKAKEIRKARDEMVQVAAMAIRFLMDADRFEPS